MQASQSELLQLEQIHAQAALAAEGERRWTDAAREWDDAAAMASKFAMNASVVDHEKALQRFNEYRRRSNLAKAAAVDSRAPSPVLVLAGVGGLVLAIARYGWPWTWRL